MGAGVGGLPFPSPRARHANLTPRLHFGRLSDRLVTKGRANGRNASCTASGSLKRPSSLVLMPILRLAKLRLITHQLHGCAPYQKSRKPDLVGELNLHWLRAREASLVPRHIQCSSRHHAHSSAGVRSSITQQRGHSRTRHHESCKRGTFANLARPARDATACLICCEATAYFSYDWPLMMDRHATSASVMPPRGS